MPATQVDSAELVDVANRYIKAYNGMDWAALEELVGENIHMQHHNRGVEVNGRQAAMDIMRQFEDLVPDRRFHTTRRQFAIGNKVVTEQTWEATPAVDLPGFATKDERFALELCCVWTIDNGQVVEYDDYG